MSEPALIARYVGLISEARLSTEQRDALNSLCAAALNPAAPVVIAYPHETMNGVEIHAAAPLSTPPERPPERAAIQARVVRINLSNSGRFTMKFEMAEDDAQAHGPLTLNMRAEIRLFPAPPALRERSE